MNIIRVRNVHRALPLAVEVLKHAGQKRESRFGPVLVVDQPVTTVYEKPDERVMFWAERDANPFFHFFESLWMLGGRNDVESVVRFAKNMENFSDDGKTFHGAYGFRWREAGKDQLSVIAEALKANPEDRRCVLQMWDAVSDLGRSGKDVPCNTTATFQVDSDGRMNMAVFNRSNDIVWGCYGANAVHFSMLLEYVARRAGYKIGTYHQISINWHGYEATFGPLYDAFSKSAESWHIADFADDEWDPYVEGDGAVAPYPIMQEWTQQWEAALHRLLRNKGHAPLEGIWPDPFFTDVAIPILKAHDAFKSMEGEQRYEKALECLGRCCATDWRRACSEWISRRWNKYRKEHEA